MKPTAITLRDVDSLAGGRAELRIDRPEFLPAQISISIRRGTTKLAFLGPDGWQQAEHLFRAESFAETETGLTLIVGPAVVDNALRDDDIVAMTFPEVGMTGQVVWRDITRSIELVPVPLTTTEEPQTRSSTAVAEEETRSTKEVDKDPPEEDSTQPDELGAVTDPPEEEPPVIIDPPEEYPHTPRPWPVIPIALVLLLLAAGAGGYYWHAQSTEEVAAVEPPPAVNPTPEVPAPTPEPEPMPEPEPAPAPAPAPSPAPMPEPATVPTPAPASPAEAHQAGLDALATGDCAGAIAAFAPARAANYGPTLLTFAEAQDSVDFSACLFETQNDIRALTNYQAACAAGLPEAKPALLTLADELKRRADQGDSTAVDVLRIAMPKAIAACGG